MPTSQATQALVDRANIVPTAVMSLMFLTPMLLFWLAVLGPLRPNGTEVAAPSWPAMLFWLAISLLPCLFPAAYYQTHAFEAGGRLYEVVGIRRFRKYITNGDLINRWVRRHDPHYKILPPRSELATYAYTTYFPERAHLVLLLMGLFTTIYGWQIGWYRISLLITVGNLLTNFYPILMQRYTRARIAHLAARRRQRPPSPGKANG